MRFLRRSLTGLFLLALTAGLLVLAAQSVWSALEARRADEPRGRPAQERVFTAEVVPVATETIAPVLRTFGEVRARRRLELRSSVGGEVVYLSGNFQEGGRVAAGEALLRIDPADAEAALATARADLADAETDLADARRALTLADDDIAAAEEQAALRESAVARQRDLLGRGVGSAQAVETAELAASSARQAVLSRRQARAAAETRVDQARTAVERRRIAVAEARRALDATEVRAAFAGVLSDVAAVEGGLVSAGERLAELIDPGALELAFRVSTPQYARLVEDGELVGAPVTASVQMMGVDLTAEGRITRESAQVGEGQTGRLLFATLDENPGFRPGDFVELAIREPEIEDVSRLPATAVDAAGGVLVLGEDDRLEAATVELLRREGDDVIVRAGDLAGRRVVAVRTPLLGAGIRIRPLGPAGEGDASAPADETVALDPDRRARLVAFVENNRRMPDEAKARVLAQLREERVPLQVIERIESRMGG